MREAAVVVLSACSGMTGAHPGDASHDARNVEGPCEVTQIPSCPDGNEARVLDVFPRDGATCGALAEGSVATSCPAAPEQSDLATCGGVSIPRSNPCGVRIEAFARKPHTQHALCRWPDIASATAVILHVTSVAGGAYVGAFGETYQDTGWFRVQGGTNWPVVERSADGVTWAPSSGQPMPSGAPATSLELHLAVALSSNQPIAYQHEVIELAEAVFVCP